MKKKSNLLGFVETMCLVFLTGCLEYPETSERIINTLKRHKFKISEGVKSPVDIKGIDKYTYAINEEEGIEADIFVVKKYNSKENRVSKIDAVEKLVEYYEKKIGLNGTSSINGNDYSISFNDTKNVVLKHSLNNIFVLRSEKVPRPELWKIVNEIFGD